MAMTEWLRVLIIAATIILVGVIVMGVIWLLSWIGSLVLLLLLAGLFAVLLMPLVDWLAKFKPIPRPLAVVMAFACVVVVLGLILYVVIPPLVDQANQLVQVLPGLIQKAMDPSSPVSEAMGRFGVSTSSLSGSLGAQVQEVAKAVVTNVASVVRDITTVAVGVVVVLVVSFYLLNEGHDFSRRLDRLVPADRRAAVDFVQDSIVVAVGGYARAQLTVALMVGVLAGFSSWLIGIRFPLIIGALAGLFELVPFFGPTLGAIPAILIAIFSGSWIKVALVVGAFIIIQQIESNVIGPRIMAHGVGLHPLVVIIVVLIGIEVAGVWGALFAVPATAVLVAIARRLYRISRDRPRHLGTAA